MHRLVNFVIEVQVFHQIDLAVGGPAFFGPQHPKRRPGALGAFEACPDLHLAV